MSPSLAWASLRRPVVVLVLPLVLVSGAEAAAPPCGLHPVDAAEIAGQLAAGRPVVRRCVKIAGDLRLPPALGAPLILRRSQLLGRLEGAHSTFSHVVDLSGTDLRGRVDLAGTHFDAPVVFAHARFSEAANLELAVFDEAARFDEAVFDRAVNFAGAEFHGAGSFATTTFGRVSLASAEFGSFADFSAAQFKKTAYFQRARFTKRVDFAGAAFEGLGGSANFSRTTFEGGATFFLADVVGRLDFSRATSLGDLSFQDVDIHGRGTAVEFSTARLLGTVSFVDADVGGSLAFDQADVGGLDLEGADFDGLLLPLGEESGGRIGSLRLDLDEAALVVGPGGGTTAQELALKLVENSARAAGDLETANDARVRRLTIARHGMNALAEPLDLIFRFGVWGYGVRPYHQLALIAVMVVLATGIRWMVARGQRPRMPGKLRGVGADLWHSLGALLRLRPPEGSVWSITEYLGFKLLVVLFVLNAANVWPVSRELIEGIF